MWPAAVKLEIPVFNICPALKFWKDLDPLIITCEQRSQEENVFVYYRLPLWLEISWTMTLSIKKLQTRRLTRVTTIFDRVSRRCYEKLFQNKKFTKNDRVLWKSYYFMFSNLNIEITACYYSCICILNECVIISWGKKLDYVGYNIHKLFCDYWQSFIMLNVLIFVQFPF